MATYDLADLEKWAFAGTSLAVIGHPIGHSFSPQMHNAALRKMAERDSRFRNWEYFRFEVPPERLAEAAALFHKKRFVGLNLTLPHKVDILGLVNEVDDAARRIGAANTLVWRENGYWGTNTDGFGLERAMKCDLDVDLKDSEVILLGAGGAARAAAVQCLESGCRSLNIGNRSQDRLNELLRDLKEQYGASKICGFDLQSPPDTLEFKGILINSTSLGLKSGDPAPIALGKIGKDLKVFDMVYHQDETSLVRTALDRGLRATNGLSMLVWQGARALEIWSQGAVPADIMAAAARKALVS